MTSNERCIALGLLEGLANTSPKEVYAYRKGHCGGIMARRGIYLGFRIKPNGVYLERWTFAVKGRMLARHLIPLSGDIAFDARNLLNR